MFTNSKLTKSIRLAMAIGAVSAFSTTVAIAQDVATTDQKAEAAIEKIAVTGSRIRRPGAVSTSPIFSMNAEEISFFQEPEVERMLKVLPSTIPGDGANVNNGSAGAATVNLRGLGTQRTLVLMDGRRMTPFNYNGEVDTASIPTALLQNVDVVTGGASAVYGSDAISGAINFIMKKDFEGVELQYNHALTGDNDGVKDNIALTIGSNSADGKGNVALSVSWMNRDQVLLGDRPLGLLGINSKTGAGLAEFNAGLPPVAAAAGCDAPNIVDFEKGSGSETAIPTRFALVGYAPANGQFRNDGTIGTDCSVFNFNPFNFYQTPAKRYSATAIGHYEINDHATVYSTFNYNHQSVSQQVAPSGTFGAAFDVPLANPFIGTQAREYMINAGNAALAAGLLNTPGLTNWIDSNGSGDVDEADYLRMQLRRRTVEFGARSELFNTDQFSILTGVEGQLYGDWMYDASYQYGETNRVTTRGGYTNLGNIQNALDTIDGVNCKNGVSSCVPLNLFGGLGTITPEMAAYSTATALQTQAYTQEIILLTANGPIEAIKLPWSEEELSISVGYEHRKETGSLEPDECLKQAPASCQGGAGGNLLAINGGYSSEELFIEGVLPVLEGVAFAERVDIEFGYRGADYSSVGSVNTWKLGATWQPTEDVLIRVMQQSATRAPNVAELSSPIVTALDNATIDPCSIANAGNIDATLNALCISTGMVQAQVGAVQDIISGQVNAFSGSDPDNAPGAEDAETFTAGFVYSADFLDNFVISVDYYDIQVNDYIGEFSPQEVLDACYKGADTVACAKIKRIGGDLTISGSGVELFTTNLKSRQVEGLEINVDFSIDLGDMGELSFNSNINKYLTHEQQSSDTSALIDCKGRFGTTCSPTSDLRWVQRTTWSWNDLTISALWRHMSSVDIQSDQVADTFDQFESIDSYNYVDLFASYQYGKHTRFTFGIDNVFEKDAPVLGGEVGQTAFNSGNTFPSSYDNLGRMYKMGVNFTF
ncbi:TonB-dependent receptor [Paraglaciecola sp.]|uniref:TonB-dependent receptor domain-containing protein n=1 Tax=Paraglaciecola sp. TaxID=1920173 RepID=UPI0030F402B5